ncbi:MAG TPA: hypothetical protein VK581_12965 [Chthoniobacterales bacterium]|nr:hypothetical protein [Chthoniobacterales bacterium]
MRLAVIAVVLACILYTIGHYAAPEVFQSGSLISLRTESTADESRVRVHGMIGSGFRYVQSVDVWRDGSAMLMTIKGNLPILAGLQLTPWLDKTVEIPAGVTEIRVAPNRDVIWRRGDCRKRLQSYDGWHCED